MIQLDNMQSHDLHKIILFAILYLAFTFSAGQADAQKRKKKKAAKKNPVEQTTPSHDDRLKAEMFHAEAEKYFILEDYPKAFALYQKSLLFDPGNATAYYKSAQIYLIGKEYEKAMLNAQKAIALNPANKYYYLTLAEIYTKQSKLKEATDTYEEMLKKCNGADEYLFELAQLYLYQQKYDSAISVYNRIETKFGLNEQVIMQKEKIYLQQSKLDKAVEEGEKLIKAYPDVTRYVTMLTDILISNNQIERAIPYLENLLQKDPQNPTALLQLSEIYRQQGNKEKADTYLLNAFSNPDLDLTGKLQVLAGFMQKLPNEDVEKLCINLGQKIIDAHPDAPDAYSINGDLYMKLQADEKAVEMYQKSLDLGATGYNIWQNIIQLDLKLEKYDDAINHGEAALELFPNQAALYWFLGTAYLIKKDDESAVEILEQGKKVAGSNKDLEALFNAQLGDAYNNLKEYEKSDKFYEAALKFNPNNDHVLNNYSYFLSLRKEKLPQARQMCEKLMEIAPDNPTYLDTYAWVLYNLGDFDEALINIEKAIDSEEISGTILEHYGDILYKLGRKDEAVKQWTKARELGETTDQIDKKIAEKKLYE